ncbi:MAG TPA: malto-oligosyltrehalose trehalohydrolase [Vicinamibacterales bacterium]|nr:malto-oligosyltrehalose trehalohydrolase [Vicinamibacterales bacterium]
MPQRDPGRSQPPRPGAIVSPAGTVFSVWAPIHREVALVIDGRSDVAMEPSRDGYFVATVPDVGHGQRYWFRLAQELRPDPVSRFQPEGPFGPSMVVDPGAYQWHSRDWGGAQPRHRQILYELHIGTFTVGGTWASARERLPHLASLGVTTLEVMPIAEFDGRFGWGYDGVFLFAPYHHYGTPDDVRGFIDAAHALGLAVILDVVYNHLGPSGNVLAEFSTFYFAEHQTEWGRGFNLDGKCSGPVRHFMRENVRHWIEEYRFDGLRFDATQSIVDRSPTHIVHELAEQGRASAAPRRIYLTAESEPQDAGLARRGDGDPGVDSIWNEDWHHSAVVALTGRREAYFTDYQGTAHELATMARRNLLYQGQWYSWQKQPRGSDASRHPHSAFVCFLENHDQVANTGTGRRLHQFVDRGRWRALSTLLLLGPSAPMLFQGQEEAVEQPFNYFADHQPPLAELVRSGRLDFLSQFPSLSSSEVRERLSDPGDEASFEACRLDWRTTAEGEEARRLYSDLIALRRSDPLLVALGTPDVTVESSAPTPHIALVRYSAGDDSRLLVINLGPLTDFPMNDPLLAPVAGHKWALVFCSEQSKYGGQGVHPSFEDGMWRLQPHCAWLLSSVEVVHERS